MNKENHNR